MWASCSKCCGSRFHASSYSVPNGTFQGSSSLSCLQRVSAKGCGMQSINAFSSACDETFSNVCDETFWSNATDETYPNACDETFWPNSSDEAYFNACVKSNDVHGMRQTMLLERETFYLQSSNSALCQQMAFACSKCMPSGTLLGS